MRNNYTNGFRETNAKRTEEYYNNRKEERTKKVATELASYYFKMLDKIISGES